MASARNSIIIACTIKEMVPETETEFHNDLKQLIMDAAYYAPELLSMSITWLQLEIIMHKHIPVVDTPLKKKIVEVFIGGPFIEVAEPEVKHKVMV